MALFPGLFKTTQKVYACKGPANSVPPWFLLLVLVLTFLSVRLQPLSSSKPLPPQQSFTTATESNLKCLLTGLTIHPPCPSEGGLQPISTAEACSAMYYPNSFST